MRKMLGCLVVIVSFLLSAPLLAEMTMEQLEDKVDGQQGEIQSLQKEVQDLKEEKGDGTEFSSKAQKITIGAQVRSRFESQINYDLDNTGETDDDDFFLLRTRINLGAEVNDHLSAFIQPQDSRIFGSETSVTADMEGLDLHQAYFDVKWEDLTFRGGRQELAYGDERLIGAFGWSNVGRAFDGLNIMYQHDDFKADLFASRVMEHGTRINRDDHLFGLYSSWNYSDNKVADFYFITSQEGTLTAGEIATDLNETLFHTVGSRAKGKIGDGMDYGFEGAFQFGDVGGDDLEAWMFHSKLGYTCDSDYKIRLGAEYNYATGDKNPIDGDSETFQNLFPTNHGKYGYIDFQGLRNMHNYRASLSGKPTDNLTISVDYHLFRLARNTDNLYRASGAVLRNTSAAAPRPDKDVADEIDVLAKYKCNQFFSFLVGYSLYLPRSFLHQTMVNIVDNNNLPDPRAGSADKAQLVYVQGALSF